MKWFNYFTKIRPVIRIIFDTVLCFALIHSAIYIINSAYNDVFIIIMYMILSLLIAFIVIVIVLNIILLRLHSNLTLDYIKMYLTVEIIYFVLTSACYSFSVYDDLLIDEMIYIWFLYFVVIILLEYFVYYRLNMEYFKKRLATEADDNSAVIEQTPLLPVEFPQGRQNENIKHNTNLCYKEIKHTLENNADGQIRGNSEKELFNAHSISKYMSEQSVNSIAVINDKCQVVGIDYDYRRLVTATFAYVFVKWSYTTKGLTFAIVNEVSDLYKECFCDFNKVTFQKDLFKNVMENERIYDGILEKFIKYAKIYYDTNSNSFSNEMIEKYIQEFITDKNKIEILKKYL